jgi:hypothetical protein
LATFKDEVEALTGLSIGAATTPSETDLSSFLVDGVMDVTNKMIESRPAEISKFSKTTASDTGTSVTKVGRILAIVREHDSTTILRKCTPINPSDRYDATQTSSLLYRSKVNPGYYELDGAIHCVPAAAQSGDNELLVTQVYHDTGLVHSDTYNTGAIDSFPTEYEYLVALYAAIQSLQGKMSSEVISVTTLPPDSPTLSEQSVVITGTAPTYTEPTANISGTAWATAYPDEYSAISTALSAVATEIGLAKTEAAEVVTQTDNSSDYATALTAMNTELDKVDEIIDAANIEINEAVNLSGAYSGALTTAITALRTEVGLANAELDAMTVPPDIPTLSEKSVTITGTAPTYTAPTQTISGVEWATEYPGQGSDLTTALTAIKTEVGECLIIADDVHTEIGLANAELDAISVPPDVPTLSSQSVIITGTAPTYTAPNIEGSLTELTEVEAGTIGSAEDDVEQWWNIVGQYIEDEEDTELAAAQLQKIATYVNAYSQAMNNQKNIYQQESEEYQAKLKKDIEDAKYLDENERRKLQKFQAEVTEYQAEVSSTIQRAQGYINTAQGYASEITSKISIAQAYGTELQSRLALVAPKVSEYQAQVADALNTFNKENTEYQAKLQKDIKDADLKDVNEARKLQKYQSEVSTYQAEVSTTVQKAQGYISTAQGYANEVQTYMNAGQIFINNSNAYIQEAQARISQANGYAQEVTARGGFTTAKDIAISGYMKTAQGYISEVSARLSNVAPKVSEYQAKVADALNTFNKENVEYQAKLQKDIQDAQFLDANETRKLQKYQAELSEYQTQVNAEVQEKTTKVQQYQTLVSQLKTDYMRAFRQEAKEEVG